MAANTLHHAMSDELGFPDSMDLLVRLNLSILSLSFSLSIGCAIITKEKAFMFTDGRYFLQAGQQMDENWELMKQGLPGLYFQAHFFL